MRHPFLLILGAVLLFTPSAAYGQVGGGQVTGIVTDSRGVAVSGVTVTAIQAGTGATRTVVSSAGGVFNVAGLAPGDYGLDIDLRGFKPIRQRGIHIQTGETVRLDVMLEIGALNEAVTVTADAPSLRATASLGHVVSNEQVQALPLN